MKKKTLLFMIICLASLMAFGQNKKVMTITTSSEEALEQFLKGRAIIENAEGSRGLPYLKKAIELDPEFAMAYAWVAFLGTSDDVEIALKYAKNVTKPEKTFINYIKFFKEQNNEDAEKSLQKLLSQCPDDEHILYLAGQYYSYLSQDYLKGIKYYKQAIEINPEYAPPWNLMGYALIELKDFYGAEEAFKMFIKLLPESPNAYDSYGEMLATMGRFDESNQQFMKAFEVDPTWIGAVYKMGSNSLRAGDYIEARGFYNMLYDYAGTEAWRFGALFLKAGSYFIEGKPEMSLQIFDDYYALALSKGNKQYQITSYTLKAWFLMESGELKSAIENFEKANALLDKSEINNSLKHTLYFNALGPLSFAYSKLGDIEKASIYLKKAKSHLDGFSANSYYTDFYNLYSAGLEVAKGNYQAAKALLIKSGNQNSVSSQYYLAVVHEKLGERDKALQNYKMVKGNPNVYYLAMYYNRACDKIAALDPIFVKLPQLSVPQKIDRGLYNSLSYMIMGISYIKAIGGSIDGYAKHMADATIPYWSGLRGQHPKSFVQSFYRTSQVDKNFTLEVTGVTDSEVKGRMSLYGINAIKDWNSYGGVSLEECYEFSGLFNKYFAEALGFNWDQKIVDKLIEFSISKQ